MEYKFDCYVVRVVEQPTYDPPRYSVQVLLNGVIVTDVPVDQGSGTGQILALILGILAALPPCP